MYKLLKNPNTNEVNMILLDKEVVHIYIPFVPDNTDYQQFKKELANGVELKDAEGNQMTPEQITTFLETLP